MTKKRALIRQKASHSMSKQNIKITNYTHGSYNEHSIKHFVLLRCRMCTTRLCGEGKNENKPIKT